MRLPTSFVLSAMRGILGGVHMRIQSISCSPHIGSCRSGYSRKESHVWLVESNSCSRHTSAHAMWFQRKYYFGRVSAYTVARTCAIVC